MKTKFLFLLLSLAMAITSIAQTNYKPGYIVLTSGDTLFTKIKYLPGNVMYKKLYYLDSLGIQKRMPMNLVVMYKRADIVYRKLPISLTSFGYYKQIDTGFIKVYCCSFTKTHTSSNWSYGSGGNMTYMGGSTYTSNHLLIVLEKDSKFSIPIKNKGNLENIKSFVCDDQEICYKLISFKNISELPALINEYNKRHPIEN